MCNTNNIVLIHPKAIVENGAKLGEGTRVWAFAHILPGAVIGEDCNICDHTFVENDVIVGNRVTLKCGVYLWDGLRIGDDVFIGPNATFTNDKFPRSRQHPERFLGTIIERGASIGANATILPGIRVGTNAMIGSGAVVTRAVPPNAIVTGNPARIVSYVDTQTHDSSVVPAAAGTTQSRIRGVTIHTLNHVEDLRGDLCVAELERDIPFEIKRMFYVFNVPNVLGRGEHAHKECHQFLLCVRGSVSVVLDDGDSREEFRLDSPWIGLYVPPKIWGIQYKHSPDSVLMVLASHAYDPDDYVRDYNEFLDFVRS